ncbi:unnamed protein product [Vitrella brassicaformis CCMP3155]|uniref:Uncharacterized protein n=1 Tax=Vitrella brassicaformis (strain CCMP3155) TaxID=1169540 RepID=A0A0G4E935_VITBC|nr:unnamed protein product [Vitrella brassicaformis CCMP3155]|eukprot:CEL92426.1 unnamed protein product [Vitrella brassicaformis CCMP3155]
MEKHERSRPACSMRCHIDMKAFVTFIAQRGMAVLGVMFSFVPFHLVAALPTRVWRSVAVQYTHLVISAADGGERAFWETLTYTSAAQWAAHLTELVSVIHVYPDGVPRWCLDLVAASVQSHATARRGLIEQTMRQAERTGKRPPRLAAGTLKTLAFEPTTLPPEVTEALGQKEPASLPLASLSDPASILPALTRARGLIDAHRALIYTHQWRMPNLQEVQGYGTGALVAFIRTAERLQRLDTILSPAEVAQMLVASSAFAASGGAHQTGGPLSHLKTVGTLVLSQRAQQNERELLELMDVLVAGGCRSITSLDIRLAPASGRTVLHVNAGIYRSLDALEQLRTAVGASADIPVTFDTVEGDGGLSFKSRFAAHDVVLNFPPHASTFVTDSVRDIASKCHDVLLRPIDPSRFSKPAKVLGNSLELTKAVNVFVMSPPSSAFDAQLLPAPFAPWPAPFLKPFPNAPKLSVTSNSGCLMAPLAAAHTPALVNVDIWPEEGMVADKLVVGMLEAIATKKPILHRVMAYTHWNGNGVAVGREGIRWGDSARTLPAIKILQISLQIPEDAEAQAFIETSVASLTKIRGLESYQILVRNGIKDRELRTAVRRAIEAPAAPLPKRFKVWWQRNCVVHMAVVIRRCPR